MYEYFGGSETGDEELEMGGDSVFVYDGIGVFGEFVGLSGDELSLPYFLLILEE